MLYQEKLKSIAKIYLQIVIYRNLKEVTEEVEEMTFDVVSTEWYLKPLKEKKPISVYIYKVSKYDQLLHLIEFKRLKNKIIYLIVDNLTYSPLDFPEYELGKEIEINNCDEPFEIDIKIESTELWKNVIYRNFIKNNLNK